MNAAVKKLTREAFVFRVLWMLVYALVWQVVVPLLMLTVILQVLYRLLKKRPHCGLASLGGGLGGFLAQIARFACFQTEDKPWPVADWPTPESSAESEGQQA